MAGTHQIIQHITNIISMIQTIDTIHTHSTTTHLTIIETTTTTHHFIGKGTDLNMNTLQKAEQIYETQTAQEFLIISKKESNSRDISFFSFFNLR